MHTINKEEIFDKIIGNKNQINNFIDSFNNSSNSSSWIIKGPTGIGKARLISLITSNILKFKTDNMSDISNMAHPDLFYINKDKDEKKDISVAKVRSIINFFSKTSYHHYGKVAIIDSISELNNYGVNSILKILEEPPGDSHIFLIDHQQKYIPSTITSRCNIFGMSPLSKTETIAVLKNFYKGDTKDLNFFADVSKGRPGVGIKYMNDEANKIYEHICKYFLIQQKNIDGQILNAQKIVSLKGIKEKIQTFINLLHYFFLKIIYLKLGFNCDYFFDNESTAINKLNKNLEVNFLLNILDFIKLKIEDFYKYSLNAESVLLSLLIGISNATLGKQYE